MVDPIIKDKHLYCDCPDSGPIHGLHYHLYDSFNLCITDDRNVYTGKDIDRKFYGYVND